MREATPRDFRASLWLAVIIPAALAVWPLFLCIFGE